MSLQYVILPGFYSTTGHFWKRLTSKHKRGGQLKMRRSHEGLRGIIKDHYLNLPKELEEFNYYYCDGNTGHVIMAIPECLLEEAEKKHRLRYV